MYEAAAPIFAAIWASGPSVAELVAGTVQIVTVGAPRWIDSPAGFKLAVMTTYTAGDARPENGGDVYLTDAGVQHWESMLDTLDIASDRWIDCPVLSAVHIQHCPDGSGNADVQLQLVRPAQVIEVLDHQFPAGHIDRVDLDNTTDNTTDLD